MSQPELAHIARHSHRHHPLLPTARHPSTSDLPKHISQPTPPTPHLTPAPLTSLVQIYFERFLLAQHFQQVWDSR